MDTAAALDAAVGTARKVASRYRLDHGECESIALLVAGEAVVMGYDTKRISTETWWRCLDEARKSTGWNYRTQRKRLVHTAAHVEHGTHEVGYSQVEDRMLLSCLVSLPEQQRQALSVVWWGDTGRALAARWGVTESRVSQVRAMAQRAMRSMIGGER